MEIDDGTAFAPGVRVTIANRGDGYISQRVPCVTDFPFVEVAARAI